MTDHIAAMRQAREALQCWQAAYPGAWAKLDQEALAALDAENAAQRDEIARLRIDAERYRLLRALLSNRGPGGVSHWICSIREGAPSELDAAIDAAMKGTK